MLQCAKTEAEVCPHSPQGGYMRVYFLPWQLEPPTLAVRAELQITPDGIPRGKHTC